MSGFGAIGELAWGETSTTAPTPVDPGVGAAAVWAYELLPGITAGDMLTAVYEHCLAEVEPGFPRDRMLRIIAAAVAGRTSGGPSGFVARNLSNTQNQIEGAADPDGNRSPTGYGS